MKDSLQPRRELEQLQRILWKCATNLENFAHFHVPKPMENMCEREEKLFLNRQSVFERSQVEVSERENFLSVFLSLRDGDNITIDEKRTGKSTRDSFWEENRRKFLPSVWFSRESETDLIVF